MSETKTFCDKCGAEIDEDPGTQPEDRRPCPRCGATSRKFEVALKATTNLTAGMDALIVWAWDGNSLTLFGVLYGIVVTVVGVIVAITLSWTAVIIYAVAAVAVLAVALLFFGQPVIGAMRWLIERGKRVPPRPFGRRFRKR